METKVGFKQDSESSFDLSSNSGFMNEVSMRLFLKVPVPASQITKWLDYSGSFSLS